ncbi:FG-GAP-like repeat-containing protein [Streptomyces sp. NPDC012756]|uniref:FG-GAP-like repeat-containing protein n=1 Tax=Streptomyces sp. NPDC012756 TaxID=3364847 RepID=UPI003691AE56
MYGVRTSRHRLALAVTAALAVTTGTLTAVPAVAAPSSATTTAAVTGEQQDIAPFPVKAWVMSVGPTGFLSAQTGTQLTWRWTRFADGVETVLDRPYGYADQTDVLTRGENGVFKLYDMGTGGDPLEIDINPLGAGYTFAGFAGTRIVMKKPNTTGGTDIHVIGKPQGVPVDDTVTGLPADAVVTSVAVDSPENAVVLYSSTVDGVKRSRAAVVDIASHAVVEEYDTPEGALGGVALSATHIAWVEKPTDSTVKVAVTRRGTTETVRHDLGTTASVAIQLVGGWLTYKQVVNSFTDWSPLTALYARSLTTGETVKLLEHTVNAVPGPDGTQMARGGTFEHGEGLYRIAPGADGARPVVTLVASTGEPTTLEMLRHDVPATIDFDTVTTPVPLRWTLSRKSTKVRVELVHTATQKTWRVSPGHFAGGVVGFNWDGIYAKYWNKANDLNEDAVPAPNGDYTWRLTAEPLDGIGPALEQTGAFKVVRKVVPHDFNDNGTPDLLVRGSDGTLSLYNPSEPLGAWVTGDPEPLGTGWNAYDLLVSPGNVAGSPQADVVTRDNSGALWLHQGTGRALAPRVKIGGGWQIYNRLTGGSDLNDDSRPDLLATDKAGDLWLYKGTGNTSAPFAPRTKIGHGWGIYNQITATDNIAGGPAGDLVARDTAGVLWLYLGKGDGTFAPRTRIGGGWNAYEGLAGFGDVDRDGRADLLANDNGNAYYYKGTGDWRRPFEARENVYGWSGIDWDATVF